MELFEDRLQLVKECAAHSGETTKTEQNERWPRAGTGVRMQPGGCSSQSSWRRGGGNSSQMGLKEIDADRTDRHTHGERPESPKER